MWKPPEGLQATLRPYQARGYSWLMKNTKLGLGSLIADDMGLGKTLQVISAVLELKNTGELKEKGPRHSAHYADSQLDPRAHKVCPDSDFRCIPRRRQAAAGRSRHARRAADELRHAAQRL